MPYTPKGATPATAAANKAAVARYDMDDRQDFTDRDRGFIAPLPDKLYATDGRVIFDAARFDGQVRPRLPRRHTVTAGLSS